MCAGNDSGTGIRKIMVFLSLLQITSTTLLLKASERCEITFYRD